MTKEELKEILRLHGLWLEKSDQGKRANLRSADLRYADLCGVNLCGADLRGANLRYAILRGANLRGTDLRDTNLRGTTGNMREVKSLRLENYSITYTAESLQIGCKRYPINHWWDFCDDTIDKMDGRALDWWSKWKEPLRQIIELSPATRTQGD